MKKQTIFDMAAFLGSLIFWSWLYMRFFYAYVAVVFYKNQPEWNLLISAFIILTLTAITSLFIRDAALASSEGVQYEYNAFNQQNKEGKTKICVHYFEVEKQGKENDL